MDELLTEAQEAERAKRWLRENCAFLLAGIVLGLGGLFGWQAWQDSQRETAGQASIVWQQLQAAVEGERYNEVTDTVAVLQSDYGSTPYVDQARLLLARMYMDRNDPEAAVGELQALYADGSDPYLRRLAALRLAQIQIYRGDYDTALATLGPTETSALAGLYHELRGDALIGLARLEEARAAYEQALTTDVAGVLDRGFVQIKLDDVVGSIAGGTVAAEPVAESADAAE
ncbi:MAG: tetratricopeptide repeat protein [Gammaproteobacteria bacterium]|nr:tetratricopeptide repeat protein [Gammaproteobacteria bacterium]